MNKLDSTFKTCFQGNQRCKRSLKVVIINKVVCMKQIYSQYSGNKFLDLQVFWVTSAYF